MGLMRSSTSQASSNSISENKLAIQLNKWWDIKSYALNCDVKGHLKNEQRSVKTLKQTIQFTVEAYEVGLLWREDEVKLPNNVYSAMVQLKSLERRLQ